MREPGHQIAVIGKKNQTFTVLVQPSGGNQPGMFCLRNQINRFFHGMTILQRADVTAGLVQQDIKLFRRRGDHFAVEFHCIARHDPQSAAVRGPAVDFDGAIGNQFFRTAPGTDA